MKDFYRPEAVEHLAEFLARAQLIEKGTFLDFVLPKIAERELKDRMMLLCDAFQKFFPKKDYENNLEKLCSVLSPPLPTEDDADAKAINHFQLDPRGLNGFLLWPVTEYVAREGLQNFHSSMQALEVLTQRFTAEFAIRVFLIHDKRKTWRQIEAWADHTSPHLRRLASEGTRPRLPWGIRLQASIQDPSRGLKILELLKDDPSAYVRRSVANHLNDVSKDHPMLVVKTLSRWKAGGGKSPSVQLRQLLSHASRTLVKRADSGALKLHGLRMNVPLRIRMLKPPTANLRIGQILHFDFEIFNQSERAESLVVDYVLHHLKANGSHSEKVFKHAKLVMKTREKRKFSLRHSFKAITTRSYYTGPHFLEIQINGRRFNKFKFQLKA